DARGRKQYLYHERWREVRDENKYDRIISFGKALPKIRRRIARDLKLPGLPRNKVLATVVQLLERTFIRIGKEEYARENKSFALNAQEKFENGKQAKANIKTAISAVAKILGNTPAICRKCYVHPAVLETYLDQKSIEGLTRTTEAALEREDVDLRSSEAAVLKFLEARLAKKAA